MKTMKMFTIIVVLFFTGALNAQVSFNMTISPPSWGPAGYNQVRYYYLPDVETYYDAQTSVFIYYSGGAWIRSTSLPPRYRNYDLYRGYKVVMNDYHGNNPYVHFKQHKTKYGKGYYHGKPQESNRDRSRNGHGNGHGNQKGNYNKHSGNGNQNNGSHGNDKHNQGNKNHGNGNGKKK